MAQTLCDELGPLGVDLGVDILGVFEGVVCQRAKGFHLADGLQPVF